ncbi:MAG TPA: ribosomal protein S18-alanine N-acetyltransferase [Ktedonobacterales bacterium]|nr:ribosomal protein S18-alanine N-acetyltransferase [Ktedonobacterales bacterium]
MRYSVDTMTMTDVPRVVEIERLAYTTPWPPSAYRREIQENRMARYLVVRDAWLQPPVTPTSQEEAKRPFPLSLLSRAANPVPPETMNIIAFAGLWHMINEAHITTIATHPDYRGRGVGELMLSTLVGIAYTTQSRYVTLEVRVTNTIAQNLYRKYGFAQTSVRRRYYSDNHEDAYVMSTQDITSDDYRTRYADLRERLMRRLEAESASVTSEATDGV